MYRNILKLIFCFLLSSICLHAQKNLTFRSKLTYSTDLSDIWGYADTSGNEYAIVGVRSYVSIVDVTNPDSIKELFTVSGPNSTWRDLKTWNDHAYITNEKGQGLLIIDLSNLPDTVTYNYWSGGTLRLKSAHDIFIDENGYGYLFGFQDSLSTYTTHQKGAVIIDLNGDPKNPTVVGKYLDAYLHDGYVRDDTLYGAELYYGQFSVVDVSTKNSPIIVATHPTPNSFTHNVWLSDDGKTIFTADEKSGAYVTAFDISDLNNIYELDRYRSSPGSGVIPHNVHVLDDYLITSYYRDGVTIVDASRPGNLIEIGNYDTYPLSGNGFDGCWGAYPFLPSKTLLLSDSDEGLFVLTPNYVRACHLDGTITDLISGDSLGDANIFILIDSTTTTTDNNGYYLTGYPDSGKYDISVIKPGYLTRTIKDVELKNGLLTSLNVQLIPDSLDSACNPKPSFVVTDTVLCQGDTLEFTNTSDSAFFFYWYMDNSFLTTDTNISLQFNDTGTFNIMLIAEDGFCEDSFTESIEVNILPIASFTAFDSGASVTFQDSSLYANDWFWEFGDGGTDTIQNPKHSYSDSGAYNVCLLATKGQCRQAYCDTIGINCNVAQSQFTYQNNDLTIDFNTALTVGYNFLWDFGDGISDTNEFPAHIYTDTGTYNVCLIVENTCGFDTSCEAVYVFCNYPNANFTFTDTSLKITTTNMSVNADTYLWDFGDGATDTSKNPSHTYSLGGEYQICLTASKDCGSDSICKTFVCSLPKANFGYQIVVVDTIATTPIPVILFYDSSSNSTSLLWNFGDGNTDTTKFPEHTYAIANSYYTVCLSVSNDCGKDTFCIDSLYASLWVDNILSPINSLELIIYPNPTSGLININLPNSNSNKISVKLFSTLGEIISSKLFISANDIILNIDNHPKGIYYLVVNSDENIYIRKIINTVDH